MIKVSHQDKAHAGRRSPAPSPMPDVELEQKRTSVWLMRNSTTSNSSAVPRRQLFRWRRQPRSAGICRKGRLEKSLTRDRFPTSAFGQPKAVQLGCGDFCSGQSLMPLKTFSRVIKDTPAPSKRESTNCPPLQSVPVGRTDLSLVLRRKKKFT